MLPSDLVNYKKKSCKIIALTAWDSISGSIAEQANVDLVLVGDSLAMVCLGYKSTLPLTLENIIYHTNAVSRGFKKKIIYDLGLDKDEPYIFPEKIFFTKISWEPILSARAAKRKLKISEIPGDEPARIGGERKLQIIRWGCAYLYQIIRDAFFWK